MNSAYGIAGQALKPTGLSAGISEGALSPFLQINNAVASVKEIEARIFALSEKICGGVNPGKDVSASYPKNFNGIAGDIETSAGEIQRLVRDAHCSLDRIIAVLP